MSLQNDDNAVNIAVNEKIVKPPAEWIGKWGQNGWIVFNGEVYNPEFYEIVEKKND